MSLNTELLEEFKKFKQKEGKPMLNCEFCGKNIVGSKWNKEYHHINICQDPKKRFFCSRQCKLNWIFRNIIE